MDSKATIPIPKLDDSNYEKWSTSMRLYLNAMKAWYLIEKRVLVSRAKDDDERALIYRASSVLYTSIPDSLSYVISVVGRCFDDVAFINDDVSNTTPAEIAEI